MNVFIGGSAAPGGSSKIVTANDLTLRTINDVAEHILNTITLTADGVHPVLFFLSVSVRYNVVGAGIHLVLDEGGVVLLPGNIAAGADCCVRQTTEAELCTLVGVLTPTAGSHTYGLRVGEAVLPGTALIYSTVITAEVLS